MANEWDVVSQEPVATAPTRRPQQASAADDPWAPVATEPRMVNGIPWDIATDPDLQFDGAPPLTDPYYSQPRTHEPAAAMAAAVAADPWAVEAVEPQTKPLGATLSDALGRGWESPNDPFLDDANLNQRPASRSWSDAMSDTWTRVKQVTGNVVGGLARTPVDIMNASAQALRPTSTNPSPSPMNIPVNVAGDALRIISEYAEAVTGKSIPQPLLDVSGAMAGAPLPVIEQPDAVQGINESIAIRNKGLQQQLSPEQQFLMEKLGEAGLIDAFKMLATERGFTATEVLAQLPQIIPAILTRRFGLPGTVSAGAASAGSQNAQQAYDELVASGVPEDEAARRVMDVFALSAGANVAAAAIPGAALPERMLTRAAGQEAARRVSGSAAARIAKPVVGGAAEGAATEGVEQVAGNVATGKEWDKGLGGAMSLGTLAEAVLGGGAGVVDVAKSRLAAPELGASPAPAQPAQPRPQRAAEDVVADAVSVRDQLRRKRDGTPDSEGVDDTGTKRTIEGEQPQLLTDNERAALEWLEENAENPDALSERLGVDLTPRQPAAATLTGGESREQLVDEWRAAATPDERAAAAGRIAAFDAQQRDAGAVRGGEVDTGDGGGVEPAVVTSSGRDDVSSDQPADLGEGLVGGPTAGPGPAPDGGRVSGVPAGSDATAVDGAVADGQAGARAVPGELPAQSRRAAEPKATPRAQAIDLALTRSLIANERRAARAEGRPAEDIEPVTGTLEVVPDGGNNAGSEGLSRAIQEAFGVDTAFFRASDPRWDGYNALTRVPGQENTIFINESSASPFLSAAAHELTHEIKTRDESLYERLDARLREAGANVELFMEEFLGPLMTRNNETPFDSTDPIAREELYAETGQALFKDKPFLEQLRREDPGLFNDLVNKAIDWIDNVLTKLKGAQGDIDISRYYNDLKAVRDAFAEYYTGAARSRPGRQESTDSDPVAQRSFHGTPHRGIERFSMDRIGTGEGNQAFGWGMYFAGNKDIADSYRRGLSAIGRRPGGTLADALIQKQGSPRGAIEVLSRMRRGTLEQGERVSGRIWQDKEAMLREIDGAEQFIRANNSRGQVYQQELPEDSELLYYDAPIGGQPDQVFEAIRDMISSGDFQPEAGFDWRRATGGEFYHKLASALGGERQASEALGAAGVPGLRYRAGDTAGQSHNYVIWDESRIGAPTGLIASRANRLLRNLTPAEQKKVTDKVAAKIEAQLTKLPPKREMAAAAVAGKAKRGWYRQSAETISAVFGPDAPLFAGLLAATSPQISVEGNLRNALAIWRDWVAAGRPTKRDDILSVMRSSLRRSFGNSLLAWENNTVRALQGQGILSGPKVDSFMRNLLGNVEEVTNDAWMANFSNVNQTIFKGALNVRGTDPGKGSGYLAMNARVRETARELTRLTGEEWTPAEVQETIWSWAKTITEMADSAGEIRTAEELVLDRAVTDELIASTPAFGDLFTMPEYRQILEEAGYGDQLNEVASQRDAARAAGQEPRAGSEAGAFAPEDQLRLERRAARRIDDFRRARSETAAVEEEGAEEIPFSRGEPGRFEPLPGAPKIKGATGPDKRLVRIAERYAKANNISLRRQAEYVPADPDRGARIAEAYEAMQHAPQDPAVAEAYADLIRQTVAQYRALEDAGYKMWFVDPDNDPYGGNPWNAMRDLRANQSMGVFPTDAGFGSGATDIDVSDNPLMADTGIRWPYGSPEGELRPVLANDLFRAVHDAFGHGLEGAGFRADGEENAWQAHVRLFTGPAVGAITTETRGQNSWLNFGPYGESNRTAKVEDTVFADQKTGLMPEWTWTEGRADDEDFVASRSTRTPAQRVQDAIKMSVDNGDGDGELLLRRYDRFRDKSIFGFDDKAMDRAMGRRGFINRTDDDDGRKVDLDTEHRVYGYMSSLPNPEPAFSRAPPIEEADSDEVPFSRGDHGIHPDAAATLNIGLSTAEIRGGGQLTPAQVISAVRRTGVRVLNSEERQSRSEPTLVVDINRALTKAEGDSLSLELDQEAIAQRMVSGEGDMFGPKAEEWGPYEPGYFVYPDGEFAGADPEAEGEDSNLIASRGFSANPQVDTPEFRRWFGDSKVVDENGDPLVVYHGASTVFDAFDASRAGENTGAANSAAGFFFTNDEGQADSYVGVRGRRVDAFIRIENPLHLTGLEYDSDASGALNDAIAEHAEKPQSQIDQDDAAEYVAYLKRRGFDGIEVEIPDGTGAPLFNWIVFDSTQIKSATGNSGAFDPTNPSIIASRGFSAKPRQPDAVSVDAYHYSTQAGLTELDPSFAGTTAAGRERRRFGMGRFGEQGGTSARMGFYVREPGAEIPEPEDVVRSAGGQSLYRVQLDNLYDLREDPRGFAEDAGANQDALEEEISDAGFDGFIAGPQAGIDVPTAVVFDIPGTIPVEAVEDEAVFSRSNAVDTPTFYSAALRAIEEGRGAPKRGNEAAWKGWLDGAVRRGDMKQSERDWLGIDDFLAKNGVTTREQLADFVRANEVQVQDVVLGNPGSVSNELNLWMEGNVSEEPTSPEDWLEVSERLEGIAQQWQRNGDDRQASRHFDMSEEANRLAERESGLAEGAPKFASYTLPGGENYRELLLTLPTARSGLDADAASYYDVFVRRGGDPTWSDLPQFRRDQIRETMPSEAAPSLSGHEFRSSHFDQPNILAHVRFNERTGADGKRVLFIEEIQSDWHQAGRRGGYAKNPLNDRERQELRRLREGGNVDARQIRRMQELQARDFEGNAVPDAPFKATDEWAMLAFKRMVRHAAENGFDRIAWTTGEQQAERYDLSQQVRTIDVSESGNGRYVTIHPTGGAPISLFVGDDGIVGSGPDEFSGKPLDSVVGKEIADRIIGAKGNHRLEGVDLAIGGEGMRAFYDKILPSAVNKWAKRFGGRAGRTSILAPVPGFPNFTKGRSEDVHSLDITDAMREAALGGLPLFSRRTPTDARSDRNQLFGRLAADGYQQGNATQPQQASGGRFVRLQYAADNVRTALQDKMLPLLRAQESVSTNGPAVTSITLDDAMNAYRMENLMHGAVKNGIDRVHQRYLQPIQDAIRKSPFTLPQFEDFLYATAAPERNTEIAKINRQMPDGGSGITTQTARDILAGRAPGAISGTTLTPEAITLFKSLEPLVRKMRDEVLDNMVDAGQITPELAASLRAKYPNYVPMRGKDGELDEQRGGSGRGISQRAGAGLRRALGRGDSNIPQNIMGELVGDLQRSIAGKEKAKVARAFLRFALANPQPDLYTVEPVDLEWKFSEATGEAYLGVKRRGEDVDSTMIVMHEGKPVYVRVIDPALRDAVLNMSANDMAAHIKWLGWLNRWRSAVLTRYNPAFTPVNMFRDLQFGLVAIAAEQGAGAAARVTALYPGAFRASYRHASEQRGDASKPNAQKNMDDWAAEFYGVGASTGITMVDDVVNLQRKLVTATQSIVQLAAQGRALSVTARTIKPLIDVIENVNEASENAIRLAAYVEQRRRGIGKERAAEYAKNVTINFNRKGSAGSVLNAIYLFYNAAMQGSHAVIRVMRNRKVQAYLAGMASLQGLLAATMMGDDDDDGITEWDKIPDYVKRTSLVIPLGGDDYFAMPMPYGFNFFTYLGGRGTQRMMLGDRPTDSNIATDMVKSVTEAFSPIPFQDGYRSLFGDQIGFMMGLAANTNDFGSPIAKKDPFPAYDEPAAINGKVTTPRAYHVAAQLLAKLGGADLDERIPPVGYLDVAPEQLEAITEYFGGGLANLVNRGASWGEQLNAGNLEGGMDALSKLPIASRMIGRLNESRAIADRYYSERGEFARHRDIVNARLDAGASLEEATGDRPPEYVQGLQQARYKRSGRRDDRSRYRKGQPRTDAAGRPVVNEEEGSTTQVAKDVEKRVKKLNSAIKDIRAGTMTNEQVAAMYRSHYKVGAATAGESALEGMTGGAADIGLPEGFDADSTAPARVRNRAIKLLQDIRAEEERRLLRTLQWARKE